eukprot:gene5744-5984_t
MADASQAEQKPEPNVPLDMGDVAQQVKAAEKAATSIQKKPNQSALPIRQYLESTVVPLLMSGLQNLCKERPEDPVEYLANYLLQHNTKKEGQQRAAAAPGSGS